MPRALSYSAPEKWPAEPELTVSEGEAVLRIPPPPRWHNIVQIIGLSMQIVLGFLPIVTVFWFTWNYFGVHGLVGVINSEGPLPWLINGGIALAAFVVITIEIWNIARFGGQGAELWTCGRVLHYRRPTFLRGIRTSACTADRIVELRTESKKGRRGKTRMTLHIHFRRRFPIRLRRVMKTSDPSLPAKVESAFREALGMSDAATLQPKTE